MQKFTAWLRCREAAFPDIGGGIPGSFSSENGHRANFGTGIMMMDPETRELRKSTNRTWAMWPGSAIPWTRDMFTLAITARTPEETRSCISQGLSQHFQTFGHDTSGPGARATLSGWPPRGRGRRNCRGPHVSRGPPEQLGCDFGTGIIIECASAACPTCLHGWRGHLR